MKKLNLRSGMKNEFVEIPVDFIDTYMPQASPEALKVYLYLLRSSMDASILLSVNDMADLFDVTPNRILQALSYWEGQKLLSLSYTDGELSDITVLPMPSSGKTPEIPAEKTAATAEPSAAFAAERPVTPAEAPGKPEISEAFPSNITTLPDRENRPLDLSLLAEDRQFDELLSLAEYYFKRPISATQRDSLGVCYLLFDRQTDVVEYLLEYCLDQGKSSFHYIEAVARGWKEEGLRDLAEIKSATAARKLNVYSVMNAYGLKGRAPAKNEADLIARWTKEFDLPLVLEAVNRTMNSIHSPSFSYTDSILKAWKEAGVKTAADIEVLDEKRRNAPKKEAAPQKKSPNAFHNFNERNTDFDQLIANYYES